MQLEGSDGRGLCDVGISCGDSHHLSFPFLPCDPSGKSGQHVCITTSSPTKIRLGVLFCGCVLSGRLKSVRMGRRGGVGGGGRKNGLISLSKNIPTFFLFFLVLLFFFFSSVHHGHEYYGGRGRGWGGREIIPLFLFLWLYANRKMQADEGGRGRERERE